MNSDGKKNCPLCMEEMDLTDQHFKPCLCGYEICLWCWHHIMENSEKDDTEGRCPACRSPYDKERILRTTISRERLGELSFVKKQKLQKTKSNNSDMKKDLSNFRVIQRNLVYIAGLPVNLADIETLQKNEFLGQYGKVLRVVLTKASPTNQHFISNNFCSIYVTFSKEEEAIRCIQVVNGFVLDGRQLKACFGTTKYCNAWLKNMPCGKPDCMYLHDTGKQEDICPRDEVASACTGVLQTVGMTSIGLQRRLGSSFPPPVDNFCRKADSTMSKPLVSLALSSPDIHSKSFLPHVDSEKCGYLPASASWGSRVSSDRLSSKGAVVIQRPADNKPATFSCFPTEVEAKIPMQAEDASHRKKQNAMLRNQAPPSDDVLRNNASFRLCDKREDSSQPTAQYANANRGTDTSVEYIQQYSLYDGMDRRTTQISCTLDATGFCPPFSTSFLTDVYPSSFETKKLRSSILQSSSNGTDTDSPFLYNKCNFIPVQNPVASSLKENIRSPVSMNLHSWTNSAITDSRCPDICNSNLLLIQHPVTTSRDFCLQKSETLPPSPKQLVATSRYTSQSYESDDVLGVGKSLANPDTKKLSLLSNPEIHGDNSPFYSRGSTVNQKFGRYSLKGTVNISKSLKDERDKLSSRFSKYSCDDLKSCHLDYACQKVPSLSYKEWACDPDVCGEAKSDAREDSVISDILSLNLGLDDPLISHHGQTNPLLRSVSCSKKAIGEANYMGVDDPGQKNHSMRRDIMDSEEICFRKQLDGAACYSKYSNCFNGQSFLFHNEVSNKSKDQLNLHQSEMLSLPGSIVKKSALLAPPGFPPKAAKEDRFSMLSSSGSYVHNHSLGNPPHLEFSQQMTGHGSHVEQTDLSVELCNIGMLPLSTSNLISPNYSLSSSKINHRLEFSRLQSGGMTQKMIATEGSKYGLSGMALNGLIWNDNGSWSAFHKGSPGGTDSTLLGRRGQLGLTEITNNGRLNSVDSQNVCLKPYHPCKQSDCGFLYDPIFERS